MSGDEDEQVRARPDLRLVPAAGVGWAGSWCATSGDPGLSAVATIVGVAVALAAGVRRSVVLGAVALALLAAVAVGTVHQHRLTAGPVGELAGQRASVSAALVTTADPAVRATVLDLQGRGAVWRVRVPMVVLVSGTSLAQWRSAPVGSRWSVDARLEPAEPGSGLAGELRVRRSRLVAPPGPGLALVERVRVGLRAAVAGRSADVRGLVPALVLGDTSAVPPDLVDAFKVAGLTHLTAVSGGNYD